MTTTPELLARLQRHYIKPGENLPGGVFLPEVGWNGQGGTRQCDALYVGFTSTSGRTLIGHELKVSREDLLRELDDPHKATDWADECHEWWLAIGDPKVIEGISIPAGWGVMIPGRSKTRMEVLTPADRKPSSHTPSWHAVRSIIARQDTLRAQAITNARLKAHDEATAEVEKRVREGIERKLALAEASGESARNARKQLDDLVEALGIPVNFSDRTTWGNSASLDEVRQVGEALRAVRDVKIAARHLTSRYQVNQLEAVEKDARRLRQQLQALADAPG